MKVKNLKDSVFFPIGLLTPDDAKTILRQEGQSDDDFKEHSADVTRRMNEYSRARHAGTVEGPTEVIHSLEDLQALIDPAQLKVYAEFGAGLPSDLVKCSVSIGSLIFDLYNLTAPRERAPLAMALQRRQVENLARWTKKDAFELAPSLLKTIRPGLEEPELWQKLALTLEIEVGDGVKYVQVISTMANHYPNIVHATVDLFLPPETAAGQNGPRAVGKKKS